jgi:hypothetical protein
MKGIGITINVDDYSKFTAAKECTLSLDKEHVKLECELINSHYLGSSQARLGWIILNPTQKLQHLLTKNSTNL